jgi:hypothetical protein
MSTGADASWEGWNRVQRGALMALAAGIIVFAGTTLLMAVTAGPSSQPEGESTAQAIESSWPLRQMLLSYLVAYNFWLSIPLGCLVILMLQHLTGGAWGLLLRGVLESASRTLPLFVVLFIPIALGLSQLYIWANPGAVEMDEDLRHKSVYLNSGSYLLRTVIYFAVWLVLTYFLSRWSEEQRDASRPQEFRRFRLLSAPGLLLYGATITFASIDWVMSLEPHWYSTIYPVLFATGQILTGFALAIAVLIWLAEREPFLSILKPEILNDLGSLLLAFVMFWAYMSISQFLLIWVGNLPEEIPWYLRRTRSGWQWIAIIIILLHFSLPFLLLLSRDIKRNRRRLAAVAIGLVVMRFVDVFWWIEPAYPSPGSPFFWLLDLSAAVAMGGIWVWFMIWQLRRQTLMPVNDPYWSEVTHHE